MSQRREIARRLSALQDIAGIMSAMRGLALMETNLLRGFLQTQQRMVDSIEKAAAEFLAWYPLPAVETGPQSGDLCIVLGSEQGFCGDFNEALLQHLAASNNAGGPQERWLIVGRRLASRCGTDKRVVLHLPGASVADEVPAVLLRLTQELGGLLSAAGGGISVVSHCDATGDIRRRRLLPLNDLPPVTAPQAFAPQLNLPPAVFLGSLTEHYVYAVLNEVLYSSLMAENRQRHLHMEQALQKLEADQSRLSLAYNAQRQEDITEEIEVILLSAAASEEED